MEKQLKRFIIAILVKNHFGVLARVSAMFSRRGFNIDSLTVGETETSGVSRITVSMTGDDYSRDQMIKQLNRLHEVLEISEMNVETSVVRELLMLKVNSTSENRQEIMDAVNVFRANVIDYGTKALSVMMTGESSKINAFIELLKPFGIIEMCRTGVIALERGGNGLKDKDMTYIDSIY